MATYTDDFNRADGGLGANWTSYFASLNIVSNAVAGNTANWAMEVYTANTFTDDQYSQIKITTTPGADYTIGPMVRCGANAGSGQGYAAIITNDSAISVRKWDGSSATQLVSLSVATALNDVVKISATGGATTTLEVFVNGVSAGTVTDSTSPYTSGSAGLGSRFAQTTYRMDDWEGGDLGSPPPTGPSIGASYRIGVWAR